MARRSHACGPASTRYIGGRMPLEAWLSELDARNVDNVARTQSYLELYTYTRERERGPDLPWLLMAHMVSRNAGYMMTDLARALEDSRTPREGPMREALLNLVALLERANYLIFHDAWFHVLHHLLGRTAALPEGRTPAFIRAAWTRYTARLACEGPSPGLERDLVLDLVRNEQRYIEDRVVNNPRFLRGLQTIAMIEAAEREKPLVLPVGDAQIRVGKFSDIDRRVATGERIYDEVLADLERREATWAWAEAHPHTGARAVYGGRGELELRACWPVERMRELDEGVHAPPEPDPNYP
ncbi:DUF2515 family protein [Pseudenhygromyxa sp. WMMC2535]|uniref:DUF2515 family protein n=1 Tax=Pseudenhygromyxa sp. WMMC2535 TaxID=2712867 RepID=UPI0015960411|nr:DUF2515 family protein [Pseudenhygromyxa sp. WMMC2535]NVB40786.1 DUF2515 family protein [Pseudenhygromyxa sp. WMMC2535]